MNYEQSFNDWSYLWETYGPAKEMTGGYVDQGDLDKLLRSPTKKTARDCLISQIGYWFSVGPDGDAPDQSDERLQEIADRYGEDIP